MSEAHAKLTFTLERRLECGGMAEIYLARAADGAPLCVKRIRSDHLGDAAFTTMFRQEAQIACALSHPNIVRTLAYDDSGAQPQLVMEYVDGLDLKRLLRVLSHSGLSLPPPVALAILQGLLQALQAAHNMYSGGVLRPVIHRDVSPHNILLSNSGAVKLADFGIAKVTDAATLTRNGVIKGKLLYLSPEQVAGTAVTPASDLYSAGLVCFEMLTGTPYHSGANASEVILSVLHQSFSDIPWLDAQTNAFLRQLLQRNPEDRVHSAAEALRLLQGLSTPPADASLCARTFSAGQHMVANGAVASSDGETSDVIADRTAPVVVACASRPPLSLAPAKRHMRRRFLGALAAIAALLLCGVGAWHAFGDRHQAPREAGRDEAPSPRPVPPTAAKTPAPAPTADSPPERHGIEGSPTSHGIIDEGVVVVPPSFSEPGAGHLSP